MTAIIAGKTLKQQPLDFVNMVSNAKKGDLFIYAYPNSIIFSYDMFNQPQITLFLVEEVGEITTRFKSRDRILRGFRCKLDKQNEKVIKVEKTVRWCSQLAETEKFPGTFEILE